MGDFSLLCCAVFLTMLTSFGASINRWILLAESPENTTLMFSPTSMKSPGRSVIFSIKTSLFFRLDYATLSIKCCIFYLHTIFRSFSEKLNPCFKKKLIFFPTVPFRKYIYYREVFQNATFYRKCCIFYFGLWHIPAPSKPVHSPHAKRHCVSLCRSA